MILEWWGFTFNIQIIIFLQKIIEYVLSYQSRQKQNTAQNH